MAANTTQATAASLGGLEAVIEKMYNEGWSPRGKIGCREVASSIGGPTSKLEYYITMQKR